MDALSSRQAVVALESTLISHGLPYPQNVAVARASEAAVRLAGAVPATVAIAGGRVQVGLDDDALERLATAPPGTVLKAARPSLGAALASGGLAATTVSATMIAAHAARIGVFATGGIGGVHRGAVGGPRPSLDISSDLEELGRTPSPWCARGRRRSSMCRRPSSISRRAAYRSWRWARTSCRGSTHGVRGSGRRSPSRRGGSGSTHRGASGARADGGVLVCTPVPEADALPDDVARDAVERAVREAAEAGIAGPAVTPWLLARVAVLTEGASIRANTALIEHDALVAGQLAVALAG